MLLSYDAKNFGCTLKSLSSQPTEDVESTLKLKLMMYAIFRMHSEDLSLKSFSFLASYIFYDIKTNTPSKIKIHSFMLQSPHIRPTQSIMDTLKSKLIMSINIGDVFRNYGRKKLMQNRKERGFDI